MMLKSNAFQNTGMIPSKYAYQGDDVSPDLHWDSVPDKTKSMALICDDPDAPLGTWIHWVMYNIPADLKDLNENVPKTTELDNGAKQGVNDFRQVGYDGPSPPVGIHRYYFKLYALDVELGKHEEMTKRKLIEMIDGHVLEECELMGKYSR